MASNSNKPTTRRRATCAGAPDCPHPPTTHGLCDAHWASRRGLARKENGHT